MATEESAGSWWSEAATKVVVGLMLAGAVGLGGGMFSMYAQLITLNVKLDSVTNAIVETKTSSAEANALARENSRRIDKIENTRFSYDDAKRNISPLEKRLDNLEDYNRRLPKINR